MAAYRWQDRVLAPHSDGTSALQQQQLSQGGACLCAVLRAVEEDPDKFSPFKPQHRNVAEGRAEQLSKGGDKGLSGFCYCCLAPAIWKTTFLFGNYKSQSALWEDSGLYQLVPSTNSQIWIRNQF